LYIDRAIAVMEQANACEDSPWLIATNDASR
jgi:hypothetical protein